jgi:hypothetical protein
MPMDLGPDETELSGNGKQKAANPLWGAGPFSMGIANAYFEFVLVDFKQIGIFLKVTLQSVVTVHPSLKIG